jgi:hypothetical protein
VRSAVGHAVGGHASEAQFGSATYSSARSRPEHRSLTDADPDSSSMQARGPYEQARDDFIREAKEELARLET